MTTQSCTYNGVKTKQFTQRVPDRLQSFNPREGDHHSLFKLWIGVETTRATQAGVDVAGRQISQVPAEMLKEGLCVRGDVEAEVGSQGTGRATVFNGCQHTWKH